MICQSEILDFYLVATYQKDKRTRSPLDGLYRLRHFDKAQRRIRLSQIHIVILPILYDITIHLFYLINIIKYNKN